MFIPKEQKRKTSTAVHRHYIGQVSSCSSEGSALAEQDKLYPGLNPGWIVCSVGINLCYATKK